MAHAQNEEKVEPCEVNAMLLKNIAWARYKKVLITGMGGGCDVFSAYALFTALRSKLPGTQLLFGNCTGNRPSLSAHRQLTPCLYAVARHCEIRAGNNGYYGSTALEESLFQEVRTPGILLHRESRWDCTLRGSNSPKKQQ